MESPTNESTHKTLDLLNQISREIVSTIDLDALLQRVLFLSMQNIGAVSGSIIALDESGYPVASIIIHNNRIIKESIEQLRKILNNGLAGWVVKNKQAVLVPDTSRDERWLNRPDDVQNVAGGKSAISVPFIVQNQVIGVMSLVYTQPNFFNLQHLELVHAIAEQAALAVNNAQLYKQSKRQAQIMTILADSAKAMMASLEPDVIFEQLLAQTRFALRVEAVSLALIDYSKQEIEFKASTSSGAQDITGLRLPLGRGIAGWVAKEGQGTFVNDVHQDPRYYSEIDHSTGFTTSAIACVPIDFNDKVMGILEARNPTDGPFDSDSLIVMKGIANLAGSAIQNAQQYTELLAAHDRYKHLFERNINSMLITDWNGMVLEGNREAALLFGYDQDRLHKMAIDQLHNLDHKILGKDYAKLKSGETIKYETRIQTQNDTNIPVEVRVHAIQAEESSVIQWFFRNIQERKELDQLRDDLLSSIYHDLRSPLSNVISSLDVLANKLSLESNPAFLSLFNIAVRSTERIQRLTNSLLDINRLEAGHPIVNLQITQPQTLVNDTLDAVSPIAVNKNQQIKTSLTTELPPVFVDADMVRRVLINLTENAVKYTPPEGKITIGARFEDDWVYMWVEDTGPGIPPEKRLSIFEKFTRLLGEDGPSGFGFGLAYCRLAIEGHGGQIWIEDTTGSGARFIFTLPISEDAG